MFPPSNPRWSRLLVATPFLVAALTSSPALAGNTHSEGGAVAESPGVPETDGTATVQIYWTGDSGTRASVVSGTPLAGYWLQDVGFALGRQWQVGDEHLAFTEYQTGAGTAAHAGYYAVSTRVLTSLDPDEFPAMTARPIPVPVATPGPGYIDLAWTAATSAGPSSGIAAYNVFRSTDGIAFAKLNSAPLTDTSFRDATAVFGTTYRYALALVYRGTPNLEGTTLSGNSAAATPLDATPPDVPQMVAEPAFTAGNSNSIAWSSEAASGATAYYAECALDAAFTSLLGNSGWIADSTFTFGGLANSQTYFYRVRARDLATNVSEFSASTSSRQDTGAPSSQLLALTSYKASSTVNLEWTAADSISGVASVQLYWSKDGGPFTLQLGGPFTTSPIAFDASATGGDGAYAFYTIALDAATNAEAVPETPDATTIIDTQPPAIPALAALPAFTPGDARSLSWSSAAASGAVAYHVQAATADDFSAIAAESEWAPDSTRTFSGLTDGTRYVYRVQSRDEAGNESGWSALAASTQDATPPQTAVQALAAATNVPALSIEWQGADTASGIAAVQLFWSKDGAPFAPLEGGPTTSSPIPFDAAVHGGDGTYAFYTVGTDAVGNAEAAPATPDAQITVDTQAPAPVTIAALPTYSPGSERKISWAGEGAAFLAQAASDAAFASLVGESGWIADSTFAFGGLGDAQKYFYRVRSRDAAGNESANSAVLSSTQDATAPETALHALPALSAATAFPVEWTGTDATSGVAGVELWVAKDGGAFQLYPDGPWASSPIAFDAATLGGDGSYAFYTRGLDTAGNTEGAPASADAQTTVDTSAPGAPTIAGIRTWSPGASLDVAWSNESASGATSYFADIATDAAFAAITGSSGWIADTTFTFGSLGDGQRYWIRVKGRDAALNETGWSGVQSTTMDATAPVAHVGSLAPAGNESNLELAWTGTDSTSGVQDVGLYWSKDGGPFASAPGGPFATSPIPFSAAGAGGEGQYAFYVRARDRAGNVQPAPGSPDATTILDTSPPTSQLDPLAAVLNTATPDLPWTGYDLRSGVAGVDLYYSRNGSPFALFQGSPFAASPIRFDATAAGGDGQYAFYVRARDGAGNLEGAPTAPDAQTRIDTTAPGAPVIAALPQFSPGTSLLLSWSNQSGSGAIEYLAQASRTADFATIAGASGWIAATSWNLLALEDGSTYHFRVKCRDAALNESDYAAVQSTTLDDTPAASAVSALPALVTTPSFAVAWTAADATSGVAGVDLYYARNGGAYTLYLGGPFASSPIQFDSGTTGGNGNYAFYTRARDQVGNREPAPGGPDAQTTVNSSAVGSPTIAALPAFSSGTSRTLTWTAGTNGTAHLAQAASDAGFATIVAQSGWIAATSYTFNSLVDGRTYWYRVKARDAVGNESAWSTAATSTQDATAPQSQVGSLAAMQTTQLLAIDWSASDATSGVAGVGLYVSRNGGAFAPLAGGPFTSSPISFDASTVGGDGTYAFYTRATDAAGNQETAPGSPDASTTIDTTAPPAPALSDEPATTQGTTNTISWSAANGATEYQAECARDAAFSDLFATLGWIPATSTTFTGLELERTYHYRVRARDAAGNTGPYSAPVASTQSAGFILPAGWNLVSFNVDPPDHRIDRVLESIAGSFAIARTYNGGGFTTYLPTLPVDLNDLREMDALHGYWIYMTRTDTLMVSGAPVSPALPIGLQSGWNLAGYLPSVPRTPSTALATIASACVVARGFEPGAGYRSYYPSVPDLSDLFDMRTGQGFWMYMTAPAVLVYGGLPKGALEPSGRKLPFALRSDAASVPTVMDLYSRKLTIDGEPAPEGTVVEAYDAAGTLRASATVKQAGTLPILHLPGDLSISESVEGFVEGETFTLRVRDLDQTRVGDTPLVWRANEAVGLDIQFVATESLLPKVFALDQNFPNPFNPITKITYSVPARVDGQRIDATQVELRVFDIRGRIVRTLVSARQAPGRYSIAWDGRDEGGRTASAGVYFYRLRTEQFTQSRKMMLVK